MKTAMFIVAQIPYADFRPLHGDRRGMLARPDWLNDSPAGFVRGFGKVSPRNSSSIGLTGEHSFADMDNALKFPSRIEYVRPNEAGRFRPVPWFRRLYFDGRMSGRFEVGFRVYESHDELDIGPSTVPVDPGRIVRLILASGVVVHSPNEWEAGSTFGACWEQLGDAYVEATTKHDEAFDHPFEDIRRNFHVGHPLFHVRISAGRQMVNNKDRSSIHAEGGTELFLSSSGGNYPRNNLIIQTVEASALEETPRERVVRVLLGHLNSVIFSYSQVIKDGTFLVRETGRSTLKPMVGSMIERLANFKEFQNDPKDHEFAHGMRTFAKAYTGRIDELSHRLEELAQEWDKPSAYDRATSYIKGLHDLILKTAVEKTVEIASKGGA